MFKTEVPLHIPAVIQSFWPSCVTRQRKDQCWVVFKSRRGQNAMTAKLCETGQSWGWQWNGNDLKLSSKEKRQLVLQIISNFLEANKANLISFNCQSFKKLLNTCRLTWQQKSPHFYMVSGFPCCFIMEHPLTLIVWAFTNLYNVNNRWHYAAIKHHRHLISPLQPWITYARVVTRYMRSGITAPGSGITTLGIGISSVLVESGIKIVNVFGIRDQNSQCFCDQGLKFSTFLWSGIKIWGKNTGSVMKKYTLLRPCNVNWQEFCRVE